VSDDATSQPAKSPGLLKRAVRAIAAEDEEIEARDLRHQAESTGATPMARCSERERVTIRGTVRSLTLRPRSGTPALEVELYDGSASVVLVWLGRREIAGIAPGRQLRATGCITTADDRRVIFNPRYEIVVPEPT
jgi:RecG-like helicase